MKRVIIGNAIIVVLTILLGFWLQSMGVGTEGSLAAGLATGIGLHSALWPLIFPVAGLLLMLLLVISKEGAVKQIAASATLEKASMTTVISFSFGPGLALFMQGAVGLLELEALARDTVIFVFATAAFGFFLAVGNYISTVKYGSNAGLRTRWSLGSDLAWAKTQRFLGRGIVMAALAGFALLFFLEPKTAIFIDIAVLILVNLGAAAYSCFARCREIRQHGVGESLT